MALALPELFGAHGQFPTSFRASPDFGRDRWRRHRAFCDPCRSLLQYAIRGDAISIDRRGDWLRRRSRTIFAESRLIGKPVLALTPDIRLIAWIPQVDASHIQEVLNALSSAGRP